MELGIAFHPCIKLTRVLYTAQPTKQNKFPEEDIREVRLGNKVRQDFIQVIADRRNFDVADIRLFQSDLSQIFPKNPVSLRKY